MRNYYRGSLLLLCGFLLLGCQMTSPSATPSGQAVEPLPTNSIYYLESYWTDQNGQRIQLRSLRGKPQVIAMIYGRCEGACPRIIEELRQVEKSLTENSLQESGFVLVTMDPEIDTPERLREVAKEYNLGSHWRLLQGSPEDTRELAAALGISYRKISDKDFAHSNTITVLSSAGIIAHQKQNLGEVDKSAKALEDAVANKDLCCP